MRKIKLFLITGLLFLSFSTSLFGEEQLTFYGIKFGSTTDDVKTIMTQKDWNIDKDEVNESGRGQHLVFKKEKGEFAGRTVDFMEFHFGDNALFQATAFFGFSASGTPVSQIAKSYSEKYGFKKDENDSSSFEKYIDSKGNNFLISSYLFRVYSIEVYNKISGRDKKIEDDI